MTWLDIDGRRRTTCIRIRRDVSSGGAFVECVSGCGAIPLYRQVNLTLDDAARLEHDVPAPLRQLRVPAAVYRVGPQARATGSQTGSRSGCW